MGLGLWVVGCLSIGAPKTHRILGLSRVVHVHVAVGHAHCSSHSRIVMSWGLGFLHLQACSILYVC